MIKNFIGQAEIINNLIGHIHLIGQTEIISNLIGHSFS